ncbi:GAP family protein [Mycobacterium lehmannii]|uniref:GAP family protein n=1 Tax=Mycobacterium lehmannii TaxID=2048550 RepID=UPI000B944819|nr:GAP family protein [Mycobacterium lehmannii]
MWGSLLGLALLISLNPVLLGFILLIISRPRPVQNLFFYWAGAMTVNIPLFLVPLTLLHVTPGFASFADNLAAPEASSGTFQPIPLGMGVVLLSVAAIMAVRPRLRERASARVSNGNANSVAESDTRAEKSRPRGRWTEKASNAFAAIRRALDRLGKIWENGSLWVAFVFGMLYLPSATLVLLIDTTIVASGAGIGEQVIAAIAFIVGFLAVLEIVLISYVVVPTQTQAVLRPLHEWASAHNRQILTVFFTLVGLWQLSKGLGVV